MPFFGGDDPTTAAEYAALEIGAVVAAVTNGGLTYIVPAGGAVAVLLLGNLDFAQPRIDHRFPTRVPLALGAGTIADHRSAVHGLAVMSGWGIDWSDNWTRAELSDPAIGNGATAEFDEYARLTALRQRITSTD